MIRILLLLTLTLPAVAQTPHSNTVAWGWTQGDGGPAIGFHVQRGPVGGPFVTIGTVSSPVIQTYVDTSSAGNVLAEGQVFCYTITVINTDGTDTAPSPPGCGRVPSTVPRANPVTGAPIVTPK